MKKFTFLFLLLLLIFFLIPSFIPELPAQQTGFDNSIFIKPFISGAPPCISCHSLSKAGIYGGSLASDLSNSFDNFGKDKKTFIEFLKNPPSVMGPIYKEKAFTEAEFQKIADFFEAASVNKGAVFYGNITGKFLMSAFFVFLVLFVASYFLFNKKGA